MNKSKISIFLILGFLSILWGTTWIAIKYSLEGLPPFMGTMARFLVALALLFLYAGFKGISLKLPLRNYKYILISSILLYPFDYGLIYWGEQYLYAGVTAVFFATFPLFTGVVSNFVFRSEAFLWNKFIGLLIGFAGITVIFYEQLLLTDFEGIIVWASAAVILSALSAAISLVIVKKYLSEVETVSLTLHQMVWGVITLGIIGFVSGEAGHIHLNTRVVLSVLYLGGLGSALAFVLYYSVLKKIGAVSAASIIYVTPLVAIFIGWLLLNETITLRTLAGTGIIFVGISLSQMREYQKAMKLRRLQIRP